MYGFVYVNTETMVEEKYFSAGKIFVKYYKKISTPVLVPKH